MDELIQKRAANLLELMESIGVCRIVAEFEYRSDEQPNSALAGYQLYRAWDHGRGGNLYVNHTHEYVAGPARQGGLKPLCRECGEGPNDGDHYGTDGRPSSQEPQIVDMCRQLLDARFQGAASAAGTLKADTESKRIWADIRHEVSGERAAEMAVEL